MLKVKKSGAKYSAIIGIGEKLRQLSIEHNTEYLLLNRGINAVVNIDTKSLIPKIDFNSNDIQVYPPVKGRLKLRKAINEAYFFDKSSPENIYVTNGGTGALELIFKTLNINKIVLPELYWGSYLNMLKINQINRDFYANLDFLCKNVAHIKDCAVIICDPNNPSGSKYDDYELIETIRLLDKEGVIVIIDCPYRRLFVDWDNDYFFENLLGFDNVIICESFSKSIGLSGQRIGFIHCKNKLFMDELAINLLYTTNGVNNFAQLLVELILTTIEGKKAALNFRNQTVSEIKLNIEYLSKNNLIANEFYSKYLPWGIFVIVKKSYDELLQHRIGSVPMKYFCQLPEQESDKFARICVSVPHENFSRFFGKLIK
jgi:aspartate aminotransferase